MYWNNTIILNLYFLARKKKQTETHKSEKSQIKKLHSDYYVRIEKWIICKMLHGIIIHIL